MTRRQGITAMTTAGRLTVSTRSLDERIAELEADVVTALLDRRREGGPSGPRVDLSPAGMSSISDTLTTIERLRALRDSR